MDVRQTLAEIAVMDIVRALLARDPRSGSIDLILTRLTDAIRFDHTVRMYVEAMQEWIDDIPHPLAAVDSMPAAARYIF